MSTNKLYTCTYCGVKYSKEKTLLVHICEKKRRALQKDEKRVQLGFYAFNQFYKRSMGSKKDKTYEEFCKSPYYNSFVKFGSFLNNVKPLYPEKYVDYVVTSGVKLEQWCKEELYERYAIELIKKEDVTTALERSVLTMTEWAKENPPAVWNHYFNLVSTNRAVYHIKDGKVSPWIILNSNNGKKLISNFNDEQLKMVYHIMDPVDWTLKFKRHPKDVELAKEIIKKSNL